ncbi:MAG TPA: FAD:protein FMN transferase [Candidatus Paceibacterota bacterium]
MKQEKILMGMTIKIQIEDRGVTPGIFEKVFSYFESIDNKFSTYKEDSEISKINNGSIKPENYSKEMAEILSRAEKTKKETNGYFDIRTRNNTLDTSGLVKGWAIKEASNILKSAGFKNFYIDAGGDIEACGKGPNKEPWRVGIRNPLNVAQIVKVLSIEDKGIATSGTYVRGQHIYDPSSRAELTTGQVPKKSEILSLTVVGPNIYEADRFATAAFAMGRDGILFIESKPGLEGYMIDEGGVATMSSGFINYTFVTP